jgi:hypothetical protein
MMIHPSSVDLQWENLMVMVEGVGSVKPRRAVDPQGN